VDAVLCEPDGGSLGGNQNASGSGTTNENSLGVLWHWTGERYTILTGFRWERQTLGEVSEKSGMMDLAREPKAKPDARLSLGGLISKGGGGVISATGVEKFAVGDCGGLSWRMGG
jgi:hypothetical protein